MAKAPREPQIRFIRGIPVVVFDLQTTGLDWESGSITQIAAMTHVEASDTDAFSSYVWPLADLTEEAEDLTHINVDRTRKIMKYKDKRVRFLQEKYAMARFLQWLKRIFKGKPVYLAAHNCWKFDARFLLKAVDDNGLQDIFNNSVVGFVDTLPAFRKKYGFSSHSLSNLVRRFLTDVYVAYNAIDHVKMLLKLMQRLAEDDIVLTTKAVETVRAEMYKR